MNYIGCFFTIESGSLTAETAIEILIAELGAVGFESFTEKSNGLVAYIQKEQWAPELLNDIQILDSEEIEFSYVVKEIEQVNWNEEWEKNFDPIVVDGEVSIRAPFHEDPGLKYDIVIEPKMSFGTGHHETTHLMIKFLMHLDLEGKTVLDMGCGTGILAIFSEMRGAKSVDAIDIDSWCYENSLENTARNKCISISVFEGDSSLLKPNSYEVIIANINRNILLEDMKVYAQSLKENGVLLLSGFYTEDIEIIDSEASSHGLELVEKLERNNWVGLKYVN
ncbi:50S ribosomal protein L11 methyltransferase [Lutimonas saemankumensis]|uniref:50S ribosomal protein L11 methyltransferase n=1 Tax=Lutimonas saemankumensis TaxID=483016 RepID=UPI001CD1C1FC|nr:50S ribosomal protein L11 methyltransferase [Lutimonas saemankumensis]MCA0932534.1 50S ribosomal protein L11 methyltransferase [Lutimonas saemankumensis]